MLTLALAMGSASARAQLPTDTWLGATGNWSVATDWLGGTAPPVGGSVGRILAFPFAGSIYTATNNLGTPFQLNGLRFDGGGSAASTITIANAAGNNLQFVGANPFILQNTGANIVVSAGASLAGETSIGGTGYGMLTLSGTLSGGVASGSDVLFFDGSGVLPPVAGVPGGASVTLSGTNTFTGNIELGNANLVLGGNSARGRGQPAGNQCRQQFTALRRRRDDCQPGHHQWHIDIRREQWRNIVGRHRWRRWGDHRRCRDIDAHGREQLWRGHDRRCAGRRHRRVDVGRRWQPGGHERDCARGGWPVIALQRGHEFDESGFRYGRR